MSDDKHFVPYEPEDSFEKLWKKARDSPLIPVAMTGFFGIAGYGIYNFRNRGKTAAGVYLMQLRVMAQGAAVGTLCLGLIYSMVDRYVLHKRPNSDAGKNQH